MTEKNQHGGIGLGTIGILYLQLRRARGEYRAKEKCDFEIGHYQNCHKTFATEERAWCKPCRMRTILHAKMILAGQKLSSAATNYDLKIERRKRRAASVRPSQACGPARNSSTIK